MADDESRKKSRVRFKESVTINKQVVAHSANISSGGLFVYTQQAADPGTLVELSFPVDNITMSLEASVQHHHNGVGIGVMFVDQTDEQRNMLDRFIENQKVKQSAAPKHTILLIDDNEAKRKLYRTALTQSGFSVLEASSEEKAFEMLNSSKIDMVVFDPCIAPLGKGFMLLNRIRMNPQWRKIVPVVLSSRPLPPDKIKKFFPAVRHILMKMTTSPFRLQQIVDRSLETIK
ncbi:MAG TPA: PilZ domain-containing protein [Dissulfurispiraceae bacterium]|nr:PilZ domain-containing protein [Dissulfurispiraceae bacterium]